MPSKSRLLFILHQYEHLGGAELQTRHLVRELADRYEIAIAWPDSDRRQLVLRGADGTEKTYPADEIVYPLTPHFQSTTERSLSAILDEFKPALVHVQSFVFWPLSLLDQLCSTGTPTIVSLYDYNAITPFYTLQEVKAPPDVFSLRYVQEQFGSDARDYMTERVATIFHGLHQCARRIVLSEQQKQVISSIHPLEYECIEPGIVPFQRLPKPASNHIRFGFLGSLIPQKGWMPLVEAFQHVREKHPSAQLTLYGENPPTGAAPPGVCAAGEYSTDDLPRILSEIDVGIIPSIFPETYSIVLSEMWQAGVPAAVSDIGALSTRVIDGVNGKKFPPGDVPAMARTMEWFIENDHWRRWQLPTPPTVHDLAARHDALYREVLG